MRKVGRLILLAVMPLACGKSVVPIAESPAATTLTVKTASPVKQTLHWSIEQPGTIAAYESTPVAARLAGYVKEIAPDTNAGAGSRIDLGSVVRRGQLLATLDIPDLDAELGQKRASVEQAQAELEQVKKTVTVCEAQLTAAKAMVKEAEAGIARAAADYDRWKTELAQADDLVAKKVIDAQSRAVVFKQYQAAEAFRGEAEAHVATAKAELGERQARRSKADADVLAAAARVKVASAAVAEVDARIGYTKITAPFDGIVTARNVHTRHFVQPPASGTGLPLFVVARLDVVRVQADVPESSAARALPGGKVLVRIPALGNAEFAAMIARTAGVVQPDTRMLRIEIDMPNEKRSLQPGMYAFVRIEAESANAIVLPAAGVLAADETQYVYFVEEGRAVKYRVQIGRAEGSQIQVVARRRATATSGVWTPFTGSERVIVGNLGALTDGAEVKE